MENMQLKYVEIMFDKEKPQALGTNIKIKGKIDEDNESLEYKFIVGKGGIWKTIREFSTDSECIWVPDSEGEYIVMIQAREKNGRKPLDYLAKEDFKIVKEIPDKTINLKDMDTEIEEAALLAEEEKQIILQDIIDENQSINPKDIKMEKQSVTSQDIVKNEETGVLEDGRKEVALDMANSSKIKLINEINIDKQELIIGQKCTIEVITNKEKDVLYRFFVKRYKDWDIIRDYETDNILKYTATQVGEKEFLIQCKSIESNAVFDDYRTIKVNIKEMKKLVIENFKCENKSIIAGNQLRFKVETNYEDEGVLYKFYKIYSNGKSKCIQEYSNNNLLCYDENESGEYRILCLAKNILSQNEYDDRAILVYKVKPYENVIIKNFMADLNSPQAIGNSVKFCAEVQGGRELLYRYCIKGIIEEDTGFITNKEYIWTPKEIGEYEITLQVKDASYDGEYEDIKKINFLIEKKGDKPLKIVDVVIDKNKNILVNDPVNIMVKCESEAQVEYAFNIKYKGKVIDRVNYNKSNWIEFKPAEAGEYEVEIMAKDKYSKKDYDVHTVVYLKVVEYLPAKIDYVIMPLRETHLVGDSISFDCIVQDTSNILMKYEIKINGRLIEETEYIKDKKLKFTPKVAGKYTIDIYAKHVKCTQDFDFKKQINFYVTEALPIINTKIIADSTEFRINEEAGFEVSNKGGKDICYEFYLMSNNEWDKVQSYSRKKYYNFIPFTSGKYKLLVLTKSYYKKVSYEDYDVFEFDVKDC